MCLVLGQDFINWEKIKIELGIFGLRQLVTFFRLPGKPGSHSIMNR